MTLRSHPLSGRGPTAPPPRPRPIRAAGAVDLTSTLAVARARRERWRRSGRRPGADPARGAAVLRAGAWGIGVVGADGRVSTGAVAGSVGGGARVVCALELVRGVMTLRLRAGELRR